MEQKKILWVILSVVLFVVVVFGVGLIWFRPSGGGIPVAESGPDAPSSAGTGFDAIEYIREGDGFPGLEEEPSGASEDFVAVSGEIVYGEETAADESDSVPEESPAIIEEATPVDRDPVPEASRVRSAAPVVKAPAVSEPVHTPTRVKEYWIQAGSFQSTFRAGEVKGILGEKGFSAIISTKDVNGITYFRVRVGPYPNSGEAEKFLDWISDLDGFGESYISEVIVTR